MLVGPGPKGSGCAPWRDRASHSGGCCCSVDCVWALGTGLGLKSWRRVSGSPLPSARGQRAPPSLWGVLRAGGCCLSAWFPRPLCCPAQGSGLVTPGNGPATVGMHIDHLTGLWWTPNPAPARALDIQTCTLCAQEAICAGSQGWQLLVETCSPPHAGPASAPPGVLWDLDTWTVARPTEPGWGTEQRPQAARAKGPGVLGSRALARPLG